MWKARLVTARRSACSTEHAHERRMAVAEADRGVRRHHVEVAAAGAVEQPDAGAALQRHRQRVVVGGAVAALEVGGRLVALARSRRRRESAGWSQSWSLQRIRRQCAPEGGEMCFRFVARFSPMTQDSCASMPDSAMTARLDAIDHKILDIVQREGRISQRRPRRAHPALGTAGLSPRPLARGARRHSRLPRRCRARGHRLRSDRLRQRQHRRRRLRPGARDRGRDPRLPADPRVLQRLGRGRLPAEGRRPRTSSRSATSSPTA